MRAYYLCHKIRILQVPFQHHSDSRVYDQTTAWMLGIKHRVNRVNERLHCKFKLKIVHYVARSSFMFGFRQVHLVKLCIRLVKFECYIVCMYHSYAGCSIQISIAHDWHQFYFCSFFFSISAICINTVDTNSQPIRMKIMR